MRHWVTLFEDKKFTLKGGEMLTLKHFEENLEDYDEDYIVIHVYAETEDGTCVGSLAYDTEDEHVRGVEVRAEFRRKGVATALYDYLEDDVLHYKISPSHYLEPDGVAFWNSRQKEG